MTKNLYRSILVVVVCSVAFLGCNSEVKQENIELKAKVDSLETVNQKLSAGQTVLSTSIENYEKALNEIDQTLAEIASNQKELSLLKNELKVDKTNAESIKDRISNIQEMLEISRKKIINLDKNLNTLRKQSGAKSEEILALDNKLKQASLDLLEKETELLLMRESLEMELSEMGQDLGKQVTISNDLRNTLNRVYYFVGEAKVLQEKEIVNKEGGFIGLGKVKIVNANASSTLFQKANKETFDTIELNKRSAKMISNHPEGSYEFIGVDTVERLKIIDKEAFWKDSNYLVIEVK